MSSINTLATKTAAGFSTNLCITALGARTARAYMSREDKSTGEEFCTHNNGGDIKALYKDL